MTGPPAYDRFAFVTDGPTGVPSLLVDLKRKKAGNLGIRVEDGVPAGRPVDDRWFMWPSDGGETYQLLDLAAIK